MKGIVILILAISTLNLIHSQSWEAMGNGMGDVLTDNGLGPVNDLEYHDGYIWAGGSFEKYMMDGVNVKDTFNRIAYWDGAEWNSIGGGIPDANFVAPYLDQPGVRALASYNDTLWIGNDLDSPGCSNDCCIVDMQFANSNLRCAAHFLEKSGDTLLIGASSLISPLNQKSFPKNMVGFYRNNYLTTLGNGLACTLEFPVPITDYYINDILKYKDTYYVGGKFDFEHCCSCFFYANGFFAMRDNMYVTNAGIRNENILDFNLQVNDFCIYNNELYVGGMFRKVTYNNNIPPLDEQIYETLVSPNLAAHDGEYGWRGLYKDMNGKVNTMCVYGDYLFVGGGFSYIVKDNNDTLWCNSIAYYDGNDWQTTGDGFQFDIDNPNGPITAEVKVLKVIEGRLYAGGTFTHADGIKVNKVARYTEIFDGMSNPDITPAHKMLKLIPNPTTNKVLIQSREKKGDISIITTEGRFIGMYEVNNGEVEIDVSDLSPGIYFVQMMVKGKPYVERLVVE